MLLQIWILKNAFETKMILNKINFDYLVMICIYYLYNATIIIAIFKKNAYCIDSFIWYFMEFVNRDIHEKSKHSNK